MTSLVGRSNGEQAPKGAKGSSVPPMSPVARTGKKREMIWFGYKVHLTETCALETSEGTQTRAILQLIVQVETTVANVQDVDLTATMQAELVKAELKPEEHIVDTGDHQASHLSSRPDQFPLEQARRTHGDCLCH